MLESRLCTEHGNDAPCPHHMKRDTGGRGMQPVWAQWRYDLWAINVAHQTQGSKSGPPVPLGLCAGVLRYLTNFTNCACSFILHIHGTLFSFHHYWWRVPMTHPPLCKPFYSYSDVSLGHVISFLFHLFLDSPLLLQTTLLLFSDDASPGHVIHYVYLSYSYADTSLRCVTLHLLCWRIPTTCHLVCTCI